MIAEKKHVAFDVQKIRKDFPILSRKVNGKPLIYFDSGATSQKPKQVIDAITKYYSEQNANIHRGVHTLSQEITSAYENARTTIQKHIEAKHSHEIIFTSGTTESINLVASTFGKSVKQGDEIIVSEMEHHSNILPWQMLCEEKNAVLKVMPINDKGELLMEEFKKFLSSKNGYSLHCIRTRIFFRLELTSTLRPRQDSWDCRHIKRWSPQLRANSTTSSTSSNCKR